jgi:hypothetical protein
MDRSTTVMSVLFIAIFSPSLASSLTAEATHILDCMFL